MNYIIAFLEGLITFVSPCLLPMLPIYLSYFAGQNEEKKGQSIRNALAFVLGFSIVFILLGAFAGTIGSLLRRHQTTVNLISGFIVILFGLNFMGIIRIPLLEKTKRLQVKNIGQGFLSSVLFGIVFSIGWTPCVGAFLGSALMMAASSGETYQGIIMLTLYSLGLGIPFIISAILMNQLKTTFGFIKNHYKAIQIISGLLLVIVGIFMMTGWLGYLLSLMTF